MNRRAIWAEGIGSFLLFATVIGSGIRGDRLSGGTVALALLGNTLATGAMLLVNTAAKPAAVVAMVQKIGTVSSSMV